MIRHRSLVLPVALGLGIVLHTFCGWAAPSVPYIIFSILMLNLTAVNLTSLRIKAIDLWIAAFQVAASVGVYFAARALLHDEVLSQGLMVAILCPVAASVVVISCMLGADRKTVTGYTIFGNLVTALAAPVIFTFIGRSELPFWTSCLTIFKHTASILVLPCLVTLLLQRFWPKANDAIASRRHWAFYLWGVALFLTMGQTVNFLIARNEAKLSAILVLAAGALVICAVQFAAGKAIGRRYGDIVAGGQLTGQKNSAYGIWMANTYLDPMSSVLMAFYSIFQNLYNSWQLWQKQKRESKG